MICEGRLWIQEIWWYNSAWVQKSKNWEGVVHVSIPAFRSMRTRSGSLQGRRPMSQLKQREHAFTLSPCFCSIQALWVEWCPPTSGGLSALHSSTIQMLISSGNNLQVTPRNNILPAICASLNPVKLTCKINQHISLFRFTSLLMPENTTRSYEWMALTVFILEYNLYLISSLL